MTYKTYKTKRFIADFNFPNPSWESLPCGFFKFDTQELTKEERHLFDAIKTAWIVSHPRKYYGTKIFYSTLTAMTSITIMSILTMLIYYINIEYKLGLTFITEFFA